MKSVGLNEPVPTTCLRWFASASLIAHCSIAESSTRPDFRSAVTFSTRLNTSNRISSIQVVALLRAIFLISGWDKCAEGDACAYVL
jgi:hypothetical protein